MRLKRKKYEQGHRKMKFRYEEEKKIKEMKLHLQGKNEKEDK